MKYPNLREEKKLWKEGYEYVIGIDEVGRGPLAGPVVACAISLKTTQLPLLRSSGSCAQNERIVGLDIKDSKQLSAIKREKIYNELKDSEFLSYGIGIVSEKMIDKINILAATKLAMKEAVNNLDAKFLSLPNYLATRSLSVLSDQVTKPETSSYLLIDGNIKLDLDVQQKAIIKGDAKVISIALASIFAKVARDKIMADYHEQYPNYRFDRNKGYGTAFHYQMLGAYGPSDIHRKSFNLGACPVRSPATS